MRRAIPSLSPGRTPIPARPRSPPARWRCPGRGASRTRAGSRSRPAPFSTFRRRPRARRSRALGNTAAGQTGTVYLGAQTLTLTGALTTFGGVIADAGRRQQRGRGRAYARPDCDRHGDADRRQHLYRRDDDQRRHARLRGPARSPLSSGVADNATFDISGLTNGGTDDHDSFRDRRRDAWSEHAHTVQREQHVRRRHQRDRRLQPDRRARNGFRCQSYTGATNVNGGRLFVTGSIGSLATPSGPVNVAAGAVLGLRGSITSSGLTNSGTVYARGTLDAPVVNNSVFNVTGDLPGRRRSPTTSRRR